MSKLSDSIEPLTSLVLSGHLLAIDPSSGSRQSLPGYAIFKAGHLVDSGKIEIQYKEDLHRRLFYLSKILREQFERPDILITENVPPVMLGKGFFNKSMLSLQKSIGVVISCFDCPLIEVAPVSWRQHIPENYNKTDEADAIMMGLTCLRVASTFTGVPAQPIDARLLHKLTTGEWGTEV